ncbi:MAG: secretin N-terminal domain-containing protein [Candidatus Omnitrophota bacterium]|nr:secretin N-terminal domain-containing protein [Candidatus Omnitrophota bacterium]
MKIVQFSAAVFSVVATIILNEAIAGNLETKIFRMKYGNAESIYRVVNDIKSSEGKVSFDANTNSLIVVDTSQSLERIADLVAQLDIAQKQVEIKVLVVDANDEFLRNIGIASGQVIIPKGKFNAILNLVNTDKKINSRSEISIKVLSNQSAQLAVSREEIFGYTITKLSDTTEIVSVAREPVGDFLEVLPAVNGDGTVTVALRPSSSSLTESGDIEDKTILTQVVVNSGDTIAIGGANSGSETIRQEKTLGIGIPTLERHVTKNKRVVMFLTATVLN